MKDFENTLRSTMMGTHNVAIYYLGQESILMQTPDCSVLVDPYLSDYVDQHCSTRSVKWERNYTAPITPEKLVDEDGTSSVLWRMFTKDDIASHDSFLADAADFAVEDDEDEDNEAGSYDSFLMDAADCACEDDDDEDTPESDVK